MVGFSVHEICTLVLLAAQVRSTVVANPLSAVTVTVEVPVCPRELTLDTNPSSAKSAVGADASQAVTRFETSSDPRPVTWSYPAPALKPMLVVPAGQFFFPEVHGTLFVPEVMSWKT